MKKYLLLLLASSALANDVENNCACPENSTEQTAESSDPRAEMAQQIMGKLNEEEKSEFNEYAQEINTLLEEYAKKKKTLDDEYSKKINDLNDDFKELLDRINQIKQELIDEVINSGIKPEDLIEGIDQLSPEQLEELKELANKLSIQTR